jgi:hypothetical protein
MPTVDISSIAKIHKATPAVRETILSIMAHIRGGDQEASYAQSLLNLEDLIQNHERVFQNSFFSDYFSSSLIYKAFKL